MTVIVAGNVNKYNFLFADGIVEINLKYEKENKIIFIKEKKLFISGMGLGILVKSLYNFGLSCGNSEFTEENFKSESSMKDFLNELEKWSKASKNNFPDVPYSKLFIGGENDIFYWNIFLDVKSQNFELLSSVPIYISKNDILLFYTNHSPQKLQLTNIDDHKMIVSDLVNKIDVYHKRKKDGNKKFIGQSIGNFLNYTVMENNSYLGYDPVEYYSYAFIDKTNGKEIYDSNDPVIIKQKIL
jgi:hypothetical protein